MLFFSYLLFCACLFPFPIGTTANAICILGMNTQFSRLNSCACCACNDNLNSNLICKAKSNLFILHSAPTAAQLKLSLMNYSSAKTCATQMKMTSIECFRFRRLICSSFHSSLQFLIWICCIENEPTKKLANQQTILLSFRLID